MFTVRITQHQRGLAFRYGDFRGLLGPGTYRLWSRLFSRKRSTIEVIDTLETRFEHKLLDVLLQHADMREALEVVELADNERALVWKDGRLLAVLGPGRHAFWKTPYSLRVERFDAGALRFEHKQLDAVLAHPESRRYFEGIDVEAHEVVLLYHNGRLIEKLREGRHVFWKGVGRLAWRAVDLREQLVDIAGQEIMTRDKVTLRVNLVVTFQVIDAQRAATTVSDYTQALYREAQLALRAAITTRTLEALLSDKEAVGGEVRHAIARRASEFGIAVRSVGLRDIILPGEMKTILNQVITAEKQAQANLIRRREETAAARSQANTAKLLADNPVLARMKELELLQEVLAGMKATFVFGPGDIVHQVRSLIREPADSG